MSPIFVLSLLWKISVVYPQHILVRNKMTTMTRAFVECRREGGSLISYNQLSNSSEDIKRHCNISNEYYWIGDYSTLTPFLYLEDDFSTDGIHPYCFTGKCDGRRYFSFMPCNEINQAKVICSNYEITSLQQDTKSSWWAAMAECISKHRSYPLTPSQFFENITSICKDNSQSLIWTNQRQYLDQILIPDNGIQENFIFSNSIVCKMVNLTDLTTTETAICHSFAVESHGYLCYIDSRSVNNETGDESSCIVNLDQQSLVTEDATAMSPTDRDNILSDLDTSDSKDSQGIIIGIVTAVVVLIALITGAIIVLRILRLRRLGKKGGTQDRTDKTIHNTEESRRGQTYEELGQTDNSLNLNLYEKLKGDEKEDRKQYEELQKYENRDAGYVYEECKVSPNDAITEHSAYYNVAVDSAMEGEEYEIPTPTRKP